MVAVITFHPGKTQMRVTAVQIFVYDVQHIRPPIPILLLVSVFPCTFQFFKMCFHTPVILVFRGLRGVYTSDLEKVVSMHGHPYAELVFNIRLPYNTKTIKRCISTKLVLER